MQKKLAGAVIGIILCGAIAILGWNYWPQRELPADTPTVELVKYCTTDQFNKLTDEQKEKVVAMLLDRGMPAIVMAAAEARLTPEQRQKGLENAMEAGMQVRWGKHVDAWLKLDPKARGDYVKKVAAEMPPRPRGMDPRGANRNNRFMTPERQKRFIESMSPNRRAAMAEFMGELRKARGDGGQ